ncbi:MAG: phosphate ABC transporter permease subunit PstC [Actinomycetota bacterium]|nr:phosphate ABC transporter permease subunit PstC [Actinomycetota bacterium]
MQGAIGREWIVKKVLFVLAMMTVLGIVLIIFFVAKESVPALTDVGLGNLFSSTWQPKTGQYGILVFITGTLATTAGGLILGAPLAIGSAIFLTQMAPRRARSIVTRGVELLAGVPSIVLGWLGFTVMVPWIRDLTNSPGTGVLAASILLGIMIIPTITTIAIDALEAVPKSHQEASLAMGATRWQTIRRVQVPAAKSGLLVAIILGMGRAIGETMAVALVIGPASSFPSSLTSPTHTLTTKILIEMGESTGVQRSALFVMGLVLLLIAMALIITIRLVSRERKVAAR